MTKRSKKKKSHPKPINRRIMETILPCNGCTACCEMDIVFLHPEFGDKPKKYVTQMAGDRIALAHKKTGGCIYLNHDVGCAIWERRPVVCREMDCRRLLRFAGTKYESVVGPHVMQAARDLALRMARVARG